MRYREPVDPEKKISLFVSLSLLFIWLPGKLFHHFPRPGLTQV